LEKTLQTFLLQITSVIPFHSQKVLSPLLDPNNESQGIKEVIKNLQDTIYPKIQSFIADAKIVLSEQMNTLAPYAIIA